MRESLYETISTYFRGGGGGRVTFFAQILESMFESIFISALAKQTTLNWEGELTHYFLTRDLTKI